MGTEDQRVDRGDPHDDLDIDFQERAAPHVEREVQPRDVVGAVELSPGGAARAKARSAAGAEMSDLSRSSYCARALRGLARCVTR